PPVFSSGGAAPDLYSFPTRRSSDLRPGDLDRGDGRRPLDGVDDLLGDLPRRPPDRLGQGQRDVGGPVAVLALPRALEGHLGGGQDRKSTRLNSSHVKISYAVFCLKK